ncbi:hypothetical protein [Novosphingobium sp. M1R2S20]|uniref:Uncharacterized protein n=1 Tax=Novosphingobium rhizovicinum TaxID=3228928 RepID=A0ABV3RBW9_9SPHN
MNLIQSQQQVAINPAHNVGDGDTGLPLDGILLPMDDVRHELGAAAACGWTAVRAATAALS